MKTAILYGYSHGICTSQELPVDQIPQKTKEWSSNGMFCWTRNLDPEYNPRDLDDECSKSRTSQLDAHNI